MTQVFLYTGATSFPDPGNWDPDDNLVECLGGGGAGSNASMNFGGVGGSGGCYGFGRNRKEAFPVPVIICSAMIYGGNGGGQFTNWGKTSGSTANLAGVYAQSGKYTTMSGAYPPTGDIGGPDGFFPGGIGGLPTSNLNLATGAGGAAGPHGPGRDGYDILGGNGDADMGGAGAYPPGQAGGNGATWDALHGCGGGGAGNNVDDGPGGYGGQFGGGAGGGAGYGGGAPGQGPPGLMVITWTPYVPPPPRPMVMVIS